MELNTMFNIKEKWWYKVLSWAKLAYDEDKNEISGLATAIPNNKGHYWIENVEIMKQENSGSNTELDGDAVAAYKMKYGMKYNNPNMKFVWWHSHHTMDAFWSGTDLSAMEEFNKGDMSFSIVINLKQEYKLRVNIFKPFRMAEDVELRINRKDKSLYIPKRIQDECEKLCTKETTFTYINNNNLRNRTRSFGSYGGVVLNRGTVNLNSIVIDDELTQLEAKVDNIIRDCAYGNSPNLDFLEYKTKIGALNRELENLGSELRVGVCNSLDEFHEAWWCIDAQDYIYRNGTTFNFKAVLDDSQFNIGFADNTEQNQLTLFDNKRKEEV